MNKRKMMKIAKKYPSNIFRYFAFRSVLPILCILSVSMLCYNCKGGKDCVPPPVYIVYLNFKDASNKDILAEIPLKNFIPIYSIVNDKDGGHGELTPDLFKLDDLPNYVRRHIEPPLHVMKVDNLYYLKLDIYPLEIGEVTFWFKCPSIFGDYRERIIVSYWRLSSSRPHLVDTWRSDGSFVSATDIWEESNAAYAKNPRFECYRMTIDGKEYEVEQKTFISNNDEEHQKSLLDLRNKKEYAIIQSVVWVVLDE